MRLLLLLTFTFRLAISQNLVNNPGFEKYRPLCKCWSEKNQLIEFSPANGAQDWQGIETPDLLNCNCAWFAQPLIRTVFGNSCMGMMAGHEFIYTKLQSKLDRDSVYAISFYANTTLARQGIRYRATFFDTLEAAVSIGKLPVSGNDQYSIRSGKRSADSLFYGRIHKAFTVKCAATGDSVGGWKKYEAIFKSSGDENYLYLGKDVGDSRHFWYFAIDEVALVPVAANRTFTFASGPNRFSRQAPEEEPYSLVIPYRTVFSEPQVIDEDSAIISLQTLVLELARNPNSKMEIVLNRTDIGGPNDFYSANQELKMLVKFIANHGIEAMRITTRLTRDREAGNVVIARVKSG